MSLALAHWIGLRIGREVTWAAARAAAQLLAVGALFVAIFGSAFAMGWAWLWLAVMTAVGAYTVTRRARHRIVGLASIAAAAIFVSALLSVAVVFGFGVIDLNPVSLVVVAGITIGNAVPATALAANQSVNLCRDRFGDVEALLALGFDRRQVMRFMSPRAAHSALIPQIDRTKVVGLIALPGALTGLLLAGADPVEAVITQLLVMYLILGATAICVVAGVSSVTRQVVTPGLTLARWARPGEE
jgi:putative ABC transport system permease protein